MSNLFVIGFDEPHKAEEVRLKLQELHGIGGKILKTSVSHEDAAKLQAALSAAR